MDAAVISDRLKELLDNCEVKAAVFTTYTFEPEFFELEVIPLLLPGNTPFSSDSRVKQFQVREALRESAIKLEVFYDLRIFRKEGSTSPAMEYLFQGIHRGSDAFHAKLALVLVHDRNHGQDCLMVGAGSNNLTRAGWWDNIECQHWEMVWPEVSNRAFINQLSEDIAWLQLQRHLTPARDTSALDQVGEYLNTCKSGGQAPSVSYYGLNGVNRQGGFPGFLRRQTRQQWTYGNWSLEIISPFFADDTQNLEHMFFFDLGVQQIHILLPLDQDDNALCDQAYFEHINEQEGIGWAKWADDAATELGVSGQVFRRLHAKVYHFYNKKQAWAFVGSVNFSHKAMWDNIEAGFFVKLEGTGPLLKPIRRIDAIERFQPPLELVPGVEEALADQALPRIDLAYDWREQRLTGVTESHKGYTLSILTPEGDAAIKDWAITGTARDYKGDVTGLEHLLRNGSLVKVVGVDTRSGEAFPAHKVMLMQTGWSHKPLDLPDLTPEQILAIYADLVPEQRQLLLTNRFIKKLVLEGAAGDMTAPTDDLVVDQFFSEYAEVFHAFRRLRKRLAEALEVNNRPIVDYYLTGTGMDSLPTLLERSTCPESSVNPVTAYLLLLCAREIYQLPEFRSDKRVKRHLADVDKAIKTIKSGNTITLEDNTPAKRDVFFSWFEQQFFRVYRAREAEE